ncbi:hypothetical protein FIBSPDRAFT_568094 [Athelia psychrophila]|uniref:Uncharacterized protein n=1 Tax=Athelia psychrophila TaxID=1759441 RepID=A0A166HV77_9AGAM|nr:hypothetical protein FIBSPDRAFT_568094 [Fibularhizoctonia sp. CBS 109695]
MGYHGLWIRVSMGYHGFDCTCYLEPLGKGERIPRVNNDASAERGILSGSNAGFNTRACNPSGKPPDCFPTLRHLLRELTWAVGIAESRSRAAGEAELEVASISACDEDRASG